MLATCSLFLMALIAKDLAVAQGAATNIGTVYSGEATFYGATGAGACGYDPSPNDLMIAAINDPQWQNSAACGLCAEVTGPRGKIKVRIVDWCPECKVGDLDLSMVAFPLIADKALGRVRITWQAIPCSVAGPLQYRFKEGSSPFWMGVQIRNSVLPVQKVEVLRSGNYIALEQKPYGYYISSSGSGSGPYTFRLTAISGQQVIETGVPLRSASTVPGTQQFGSTPISGDIKWQVGADGYWALGCDFNGQELRSAKSTGAQCSTVCKGASGCTHYAWTPFNGGTCWMKQGAAAQKDAIKSAVSGILCGINSASSGGGGGGISWNGNWAFGCDFKGQDLTSAPISGSNCGSRCASTSGCTHFTWTNYNGGTCWMKQGTASKSDAFATGDSSMVCGVL